MVVVLVQLTVRQENLDAFKKAVLKNATASVRKEKECHRFDVCRSEADPTEWLLYEVYTDRAAFESHHQQPHFLEYSAAAQNFVLSKKLTTFIMQNP